MKYWQISQNLLFLRDVLDSCVHICKFSIVCLDCTLVKIWSVYKNSDWMKLTIFCPVVFYHNQVTSKKNPTSTRLTVKIQLGTPKWSVQKNKEKKTTFYRHGLSLITIVTYKTCHRDGLINLLLSIQSESDCRVDRTHTWQQGMFVNISLLLAVPFAQICFFSESLKMVFKVAITSFSEGHCSRASSYF